VITIIQESLITFRRNTYHDHPGIAITIVRESLITIPRNPQVGAVGIELKAALKTGKLLILRNDQREKNRKNAEQRYTRDTRMDRLLADRFCCETWWSRWDCKSAVEENRRKTAKFPSLLPLTDFSNVP